MILSAGILVAGLRKMSGKFKCTWFKIEIEDMVEDKNREKIIYEDGLKTDEEEIIKEFRTISLVS